MPLIRRRSHYCQVFLAVFLYCFLAGCVSKKENIQTAEHIMAPGLSPLYFDKFLRHLNQMPPSSQGRPGAPILLLNHRFEKNEVFSSGLSRGVGIQMTGFLHLEVPGIYRFKAMSNDGIALHIDDQLIFEDPRVHSDRYSPTGSFTAPAKGHYPLLIRYFQRKGTATLVLYWQGPNETSFEVIPATAYFH